MYYLLFIIFVCLYCFFLSKNRFIKSTGLPVWSLNGLFIAKAAIAVMVGFMLKDKMSDSWQYNSYGQDEYKLLFNHPSAFFYDFIRPGYLPYLGENILVKLISLMNIFTRGNYYINSLLFVMMGFIGSVALYKVFRHIYTFTKWPLIIGCFLLPSVVIFTSIIHKDAIIFCMLGLFCYALYFSLQEKLTLKRLLILLVTAVLITMVRSYVMIILLPCTLALVIAGKLRINAWLSFAAVYICSILLLLAIQLTAPRLTPLRMVSDKQAEFFNLPVARSQVATDTLYPTLQSFARNSPQALTHTIFQPYLFQFSSIRIMNFFALEIHFYMLLLLLMLLFFKRTGRKPFVCFSIIFSLSMFLIIGYIVPNTGAITRYRSIFLPFLITPLLCQINWQKIKPFLHIKI